MISHMDSTGSMGSTNTLISTVSSSKVSSASINMLNDFQLDPLAIVCTRNSSMHKNPGNKRYNAMIQEYRERYQACSQREEKTQITKTVIKEVEAYGGRFVKFCSESETWVEIDSDAKREKVSHALRIAGTSKKRRATKKQPASLRRMFSRQQEMFAKQDDDSSGTTPMKRDEPNLMQEAPPSQSFASQILNEFPASLLEPTPLPEVLGSRATPIQYPPATFSFLPAQQAAATVFGTSAITQNINTPHNSINNSLEPLDVNSVNEDDADSMSEILKWATTLDM